MSLHGWPALGAAAAAVALVELDGACVGQFMLSRPVVLGPLIGLSWGEPMVGFVLGALVECLSLEQLPVGGNLPLNPTVAASAGILLSVGPSALPLEVSLPAGFGAGWAHRRVEYALRQRRRKTAQLADERLESGACPPLGRLAARALAGQAAATLGVMAAALFILGPLLAGAWPRLPWPAQAGLRFAFSLAPWLALATLLRAARPWP